MNARSPYFLSTAGHMMALLALWILSTLSPRYDFEVIDGIELIMPAAGSAERQAVEPTPPSVPDVPEEPEPVPPAPPPEKERKRPVPEEVSEEEPQPDGLKPPSKDALVPSKRGEEQQLPPQAPPPQHSDTPDAGSPETSEYRGGIGEGMVDGNALGKHADWYLMQLHHKLSSTWAPPAQGGAVGVQMVRVHFVIQPDGSIRDVRIVEGNATTRFERSVQRCVLNASPLPPLPEDLGLGSIGVTVPFRKQY